MKTRRRRTIVLIVLTVALVGAALAVLLPRWLDPFPPFDQLVKMRVVYSVPGMERVAAQRDVVYTSRDGTSLKADVYTPPGLADGARVPAVILVHGGPIEKGMSPKDWGQYLSYGELLAASGVAAVTFNYRYEGQRAAELYWAGNDVQDLIAHVRKHQEALHIDGDRLAVWVFSGGGLFLTAPAQLNLPPVRCLVSFYGVLDVPDGSDGRTKSLAPIEQLEHIAVLPPVLIVKAGRDNPWINTTVDRFVSRARDRHFDVQVLDHPQGHHAFDVIDDNDVSRARIKATIEFLRLHLAVKG
jgi:acetyl esterase/lipase